MAKKNINITAQELLKRSKLSGRVNGEYSKIVNDLINTADCGAQVTSVDVSIDIADAIRRRLISNGFSVSDGEIHKDEIVRYCVSWTQKDCDAQTTAICSDLTKAEAHYAEKKCNQVAVSINGKPADQIEEPKPARKKPLPTPPSSTAPAPATNVQGVTVIKNGKPVNNIPAASKSTNNQPTQQYKKRRRNRRYNNHNIFHNSIIFEGCTFNVTTNVDNISVSK